jgi:hypothetical protein
VNSNPAKPIPIARSHKVCQESKPNSDQILKRRKTNDNRLSLVNQVNKTKVSRAKTDPSRISQGKVNRAKVINSNGRIRPDKTREARGHSNKIRRNKTRAKVNRAKRRHNRISPASKREVNRSKALANPHRSNGPARGKAGF